MIWQELPKPLICLAPMEGVTDSVFRRVIAAAGRPDLFFTEFTNVSSFASPKGRANALERLTITPSDPPIIAQIWGSQPEHFSQLVKALAEAALAHAQDPKIPAFSGIDLNFGCPDRHVNQAGGGAAMIRTPKLAQACIRRAKQAAGPLPISVKTRLGFTYLEEYRDWLSLILREQPAALTVHLRTRKEMSKVPAHFELIPELVRLRAEISPETKLLINGDIPSRAAALELYAQYPELDGFMIGRGVFQNPFCFKSTADNSAYSPSQAELFSLFELHLNLYETYQQSLSYPLSFEPLKHFFKIYINNFPGAVELRTQLMATHSVAEARAIYAQIKK